MNIKYNIVKIKIKMNIEKIKEGKIRNKEEREERI